MRHRKKDTKLGRSSASRKTMLASLVCSLIEQERIKTTVAKAKIARSMAEKMVTLARKGGSAATADVRVSARRRAAALLMRKKFVSKLFDDLAPRFEGRQGGYTRITKIGRRHGDGAEMAVLEWIGVAPPENKTKKTEVDEKTEEA
ncbi:MAG: 50S ribosomal protein L17 [Kiritimatiellae bacterium]|nr:50S ribosomal protein L17 [Kiritimatiellia bacterium]